MIFERHSRGKIFGETDICVESELCKESFVADSDIWKSKFRQSKAEKSKIRLSELERSSIENAEITESIIQNSVITGGTSLGSRLYTATVKDKALIRNSVVINSIVTDYARVINATLINVTIDKKMRVENVWERQPRYLELNNSIADLGITEAQDGYAFIACRKQSIKRWLKGKWRYANVVGWNEQMVKEITQTFEEWQDIPKMEVVN